MKPRIEIERFEVFAEGLDHPEGLAFDRQGNLWAGGEAGQVYRIDSEGKVDEVVNIEGFCGGLAFSPADELFLCNAKWGLVRVQASGSWEVFADRAGDHRIVCANYPLFDKSGQIYVTDSGDWKGQNGFILRFNSQGQGEVAAGPFGYANGLVMSADGTVLFMVESDTARVYRFDVQGDGALGSPTILVEGVGRVPDGLAVDEQGDLYICCYASDDIYRVTPEGKKDLLAWDPNGMLLGRPTNLAFGPEDTQVLYVANLGRYVITRARIDRKGQLPANYRSKE